VATVLLVGAAGFAGAVSRYLIDEPITRMLGGGLPWGTFVVNVSGSFLVGALFALIVERAALPVEARAPLMIGFLGAYTTFSTLALESWRMIEDGSWLLAAANLGGSVVVGMAAVILGVAAGRLV